ncbi:MAG: sulfatase-like hydrolase/transferase [Planctomycetes bacterium]|nr:sulfatase-like hydrolase/transferase [Planctomycetota bacterium]
MTPLTGQTEVVINGYAPTMRILSLVAVITAFAVGQKPPNIILFMVDDLGWQDVSVPFHTEKTAFNRRYRTPNLEKLAERGMKFTNGYASAPVCTPTRTSLMTGQCPARTHITYWTLHKDRDQSAKHKLVRAPKWDVNALQGKRATLPRALKAMGGYRSIHAGKAHLGAKGTRGEDPTRLGSTSTSPGTPPGGRAATTASMTSAPSTGARTGCGTCRAWMRTTARTST